MATDAAAETPHSATADAADLHDDQQQQQHELQANRYCTSPSPARATPRAATAGPTRSSAAAPAADARPASPAAASRGACIDALVAAEERAARTANPYSAAVARKRAADAAAEEAASGCVRAMFASPTNNSGSDRSFDAALATMDMWLDTFDANRAVAVRAIARIEELGEKFWGAFRNRFGILGLSPQQMSVAYLRSHVATLEARAPFQKHRYMLGGFGLSREVIEVSYSATSGAALRR